MTVVLRPNQRILNIPGIGVQTSSRRAVSAGGASNGLLNNLVAYWTLDETSGTRNDSVGTSHLTDTNTVGYAAGKQGNAGDFIELNNEYLSVASNSVLQMGNIDFTIACWIYPHNVGGTNFFLTKDSSASGKREYYLVIPGGPLQFGVFTFNNVEHYVRWAPDLTANNWYFVVAWHNATADTINIAVNNGTPVSAATGGSLQAASDAVFALGDNGYDFSGGTFNYDGLIDEVGLWKRILTSDQRTLLYNAGAGLAYSEFS